MIHAATDCIVVCVAVGLLLLAFWVSVCTDIASCVAWVLREALCRTNATGKLSCTRYLWSIRGWGQQACCIWSIMLFLGRGWWVACWSAVSACTIALWPSAVQYIPGLPQGHLVKVTSDRSTILNCVRYGGAIFRLLSAMLSNYNRVFSFHCCLSISGTATRLGLLVCWGA